MRRDDRDQLGAGARPLPSRRSIEGDQLALLALTPSTIFANTTVPLQRSQPIH
jgi:hypothetical protein